MSSPTAKSGNIYKFKRGRRRLNKSKQDGGKPPRRIRLTIVAKSLIAFLCAIVCIAVFWAFTNKNAQQVMVGQIEIGAVKGLKLTEEELYNLAVEKLKVEVGANVAVNEAVKLTPVHAKKSEIFEYNYVVSEIVKSFTYTIEASVIVVDGVEMAVVKSKADVEMVFEDIFNIYRQADKNIIETSIVDEYEIKSKFVSKDEIMSVDKAYNVLTAQKETEETYTVASGDSLWGIANKSGISVEKLIELNSGITYDTILKVGQTLTLILPKPILSIRTVEETTANVLKKKSEEYVENPNMPKSHKKSLQQGTDGQATVTIHTVRINGLEKSREEVREEIVIPPVNDIIEIGTKK